jgi:hypothetical protein
MGGHEQLQPPVMLGNLCGDFSIVDNSSHLFITDAILLPKNPEAVAISLFNKLPTEWLGYLPPNILVLWNNWA